MQKLFEPVYCVQESYSTLHALFEHAQHMRQHSYAPYSSFQVGAALLTEENQIIGGCNVESMVYGLTMCAERTAIFTAIAQGKKHFKALAVTAGNGDCTPCGACRQIIVEICGNIPIVNIYNGVIQITPSYYLLPHSFTFTLPTP